MCVFVFKKSYKEELTKKLKFTPPHDIQDVIEFVCSSEQF